MKHRHNKGNAVTEAAPVERESVRAAAVTVGSGSVIVDAVGLVSAVETPSVVTSQPAARREATQQEIAELAYSYWIARGYGHGNAEQDWLRAERELRQR